MAGELLGLVVILLIVGVVLHFFPIDGTIKNLILCLIVIAVILVIAHGFGLFGGGHWSF